MSQGFVSLPEPVGAWTAWARKMRTLATVARRSRAATLAQDLSDKADELCEGAAGASSLPAQIRALWQVESLVFAAGDQHFDATSLAEIALPSEAHPPAHCGLSMAAVLHEGFAPDRLTSLIETKSNPLFVSFAFETLGLMAAAYEPDTFGRITDLLGRAGMLRRYRLQRCDSREFLAALPERWQPFAAHGFGRLLYFKSHRLRDTLRKIEARQFLPFSSAVKGAIAAYVLINSRDLPEILTLADAEIEPRVAGAIQGGLLNVLTLLEWSLPGCLSTLEPRGPLAREILSTAVGNATDRRLKGEGPGLVA